MEGFETQKEKMSGFWKVKTFSEKTCLTIRKSGYNLQKFVEMEIT